MRSLFQMGSFFLLLVACSMQQADVEKTPQSHQQYPFDQVQDDSGLNHMELETDKRSMQRHTLVHDGLTREYFIFDPPGGVKREQGNPLLIFLHGYGGTATGTEAETTNGLNRYAARYGYSVVYPQGTWFESHSDSGVEIVSSWNDLGGNQDDGPLGPLCAADAPRYPCPPECGECGRCGWASCHDDVGFLSALIAHLRQSDTVDADNLFIAGFSNGSMMAHRMACVQSHNLKAAALIGGRLELGYSCTPEKVLPLMQLSGKKDSVVPYEGVRAGTKFYYTSVAQVQADWAVANACTEPVAPWPVFQNVADIKKSAPQLECGLQCAGSNRELLSCLWVEGAHVWPGYPEGHGSGGYCASALQKPGMPAATLCVEPDITANDWGSHLIFSFFERHRD